MIIAVAGEKGGTGKSTIACTLAAGLTKHGKGTTLLVDTDSQPSSSLWAALREQKGVGHPVRYESITGAETGEKLMQISQQYDDIVVDTPGRDCAETRFALGLCNVAIIPIRPSQFDVWTLAELNEAVGEIKQEANPDLRACIVANMAIAGSRAIADMARYITEAGLSNLELLTTVLYSRIGYSYAAGEGIAVFEREKNDRDRKAARECISLFCEIYPGICAKIKRRLLARKKGK